MAKRAGLPIASFVAATNVNDVVPEYLETGRFEPRASVATIANAMDVGNPSNFDRMTWLYGGSLDAMRRDVSGSRHADEEVRATIRRVYDERGYLLDPHSAIGYLGITGPGDAGARRRRARVPRDRASGEVRGNRRADHRPRPRAPRVAGRRACRGPPHHPPGRHARRAAGETDGWRLRRPTARLRRRLTTETAGLVTETADW